MQKVDLWVNSFTHYKVYALRYVKMLNAFIYNLRLVLCKLVAHVSWVEAILTYKINPKIIHNVVWNCQKSSRTRWRELVQVSMVVLYITYSETANWLVFMISNPPSIKIPCINTSFHRSRIAIKVMAFNSTISFSTKHYCP